MMGEDGVMLEDGYDHVDEIDDLDAWYNQKSSWNHRVDFARTYADAYAMMELSGRRKKE